MSARPPWLPLGALLLGEGLITAEQLELALLEGRLEVDDLPSAWGDGMQDLLGLEVPDDRNGVLQDIHWGQKMIGYFPTYTLGNLMAAQL